MNSWQIRTSGVLLAMLLAGCATSVSNNVKPSAAHVAKYNELSALEVVSTLEKNVNEAKSANMPFLAPHYYRDAAKILGECQSGLGSKSKEVLVNNAAKAEAILEKGRSLSAVVQYRFAKELEYKTQLEEHNAPKLLAKEYEKVIAEFSRLIEKVERERADDIDKDKEALKKSMLDLVIKAVQENALHDSEAINLESKKKNAEKQAPLTYNEALRVFQDARNKIATAHHDKALVQRLSAEALFAARHAQQVNERVALLQTQLNISHPSNVGVGIGVGSGSGSGLQLGLGLGVSTKLAPVDKVTVEQVVLHEENHLLAISKALGLRDLRDLPLDQQVEEIKRAAAGAPRQAPSETGVTIKPLPASTPAPAADIDAQLADANEATRQAMAALATKEQQLAEKDQQLVAQNQLVESQTNQLANQEEKIKDLTAESEKLTAQLADKDAQIQTLKDKVAQLENTAAKPKAVKPKTAKPAKK
jgi:hypothetical protein